MHFENKYPFSSPGKVTTEALMQFYDLELGTMANELVDSLTPAVKSMQAVQIVLQMQLELADYVKEKGKSDKAIKSAKRLFELYDCVVSLNRLTGDLNTLQLTNRELHGKMQVLRNENAELKLKIENMVKAENF